MLVAIETDSQTSEGTARPNGLRISRRKRLGMLSKIAMILRAQRSVACACWVALLNARRRL